MNPSVFIILFLAVSSQGQNATVTVNVTASASTAAAPSATYGFPQSALTIFASIRASYNSQSFQAVVNLITLQAAGTTSSTAATLSAVFAVRGQINYDLAYQSSVSGNTISYTQAVSFNSSLALGTVLFNVTSGQLSGISFSSAMTPPLLNLFNQNISQVALSVFLQGNETIKFNKNRQQPLDSLSTIPLTLEYARQVGINSSLATNTFAIQKVKRFFIPKVDLGISGFKRDSMAAGVIVNRQVNLAFVAPEMTQFFVAKGSNNFASNGVAEFMLDTLTQASVDATIAKIGLVQTATVYPASAILALTNFKGQKRAVYLQYKQNLTFTAFISTQKYIHSRLLLGKSNHLLQNAQYSFLSQSYRSLLYKYSTCSTTFQYATLMQQINTGAVPTFTQVQLTAAMAILTPISQQQPFEQQYFSSDAGAVVQTRDLFNAAGYSNLLTAVNGTKQVSFALLVQGLSKVQQQQYSGQLSLFVYFIAQNPTFVVDFGSRLSATQ